MIWQISAHFLHLHIQIRIQYRTVFYQKPGFANLSTECLQYRLYSFFSVKKYVNKWMVMETSILLPSATRSKLSFPSVSPTT